jgi:hypothetical protein
MCRNTLGFSFLVAYGSSFAGCAVVSSAFVKTLKQSVGFTGQNSWTAVRKLDRAWGTSFLGHWRPVMAHVTIMFTDYRCHGPWQRVSVTRLLKSTWIVFQYRLVIFYVSMRTLNICRQILTSVSVFIKLFRYNSCCQTLRIVFCRTRPYLLGQTQWVPRSVRPGLEAGHSSYTFIAWCLVQHWDTTFTFCM